MSEEKYFVDAVWQDGDKKSYWVRLLSSNPAVTFYTGLFLRYVKVSSEIVAVANVPDEEVRPNIVYPGREYKMLRAELSRFCHTGENADQLFADSLPTNKQDVEIMGKADSVKHNREYFEHKFQKENSRKKTNGLLKLYGFNVGQGDSLLLITPGKNAYLIDTNLYSQPSCQAFADKLQSILNENDIDGITGIVATHKHIDHIRGMKNLLQCLSDSGIACKYFMINGDYCHSSRAVVSLLEYVLQEQSLKVINMNGYLQFIERDTSVEFYSLGRECKNLNDSSILMAVRYRNGEIYLTGDAGDSLVYSYSPTYVNLERCVGCNNFKEAMAVQALADKKIPCAQPCTLHPNGWKRLLKISHHGSQTGTGKSFLEDYMPNHSFVSAGSNKKYNHPHPDVSCLLGKYSGEVFVTKDFRCDVCYTYGNDIWERESLH